VTKRASPRETRPEGRRTSGGEQARDVSVAELAAQARSLFAPWFVERRFDAGHLLWREGERTGLLVALRTGRVKVYRLLPTGRAITLFLFGPDDVFGFLPFLDGGAYPADAQALDDVTANVMPRAALEDAVRARPEAAMTLLSLLGRRLRESFDRIESLSTPGVVPRVAAAIHALCAAGAATSPVSVVELPVPAAEVAAALGITPETLSRAISRLVADRIVHRLGPRRMQILDPGALERAARLADR
jgi:CRP/FNR family transcriptional regulator